MKKWDLLDLLEGHEGAVLWSPICGSCELLGFGYDDGVVTLYPLRVRDCVTSVIHLFMGDGRYVHYEGGGCVLWPKEGVYSWDNVKWVSSTEFVIDGEDVI